MYQNSSTISDESNVFLDFNVVGGNGAYLYDEKSNPILDFSSHLALGHSSSIVEKSLLKTLNNGIFSCSEEVNTKIKEELVEKFCKLVNFIKIENREIKIDGDVLFCNSRIDAIENAINIARNRYNTLCDRKYNEIICFENCYHENYLKTAHIVEKTIDKEQINSFKIAKFNDIKSVEKLITEDVSAVILETTQFAKEIRSFDDEFLKKLRKLCDENEILLIIDNTFCGFCENDYFFSYQSSGIKPDILCIGDVFTNGMQFGACILNKESSNFIVKTTFKNDNFFNLNVANSVFDIITNNSFIENVKNSSIFMQNEMLKIENDYQNIIDKISSAGLIFNIKLKEYVENSRFAKILLSNELFVLCYDNNSIFLLPNLNITKDQLEKAVDIIKLSIEELGIIERY